MVEQQKSKGTFILEIHGLKPMNRETPGSAWKPMARKFRILFSVKSSVQVSIFPKSSDIPCKSPRSQQATMKGVDSDHGKSVYIEADQFTIRPENLSILGDKQPLIFDKSYRLMISVNFGTGNDAEQVYRHLGIENAEQNAHTRLSTMFENILECPQETTILPLKDPKKRRLDFGLEVSMYWTSTQTDSILSNYSQQTRMRTQPDSYPTPPLDIEKPRYKLTFVYAKETIKRSSLVCPHPSCQKRKPTNISDLRMHLDSWHDYFRYRAIQEKVDDGVEHWRFECEVSDHKADQRASDKADEPFDVRVMPPPQPFNQRRYLIEGNDEYQRAARLERPTKLPVSKTVVMPPSIPMLRRKPPDEVQERPRREKKRFPVPRAPRGITFFRSASKRPLKEGEMISESDDEIDTRWIELRKAAEDQKNKSLSDTARRFLIVFDKFMGDEHLHSDIHASDALIRFAREKGAWLWQEQIIPEFKTKIDELLEDEIISNEVYAACLGIVQTQKLNGHETNELSQRLAELDVQSARTHLLSTTAGATEPRPPQKDRKGKGKAKVTDTGHLTPITADSDGDVEMRETSLKQHSDPSHTKPQDESLYLPYDVCYCGVEALLTPHASTVVACNSIVSTTSSEV
ncbi:Nn.00g074990.m01.CDS01 [Neocucurbitaria sp. VM-36]